ncbi:MAG: hit [Gemmatimonadetes bacterium]|nr:hit [Gemmatimonadota bacterium]
MPPSPAAGRCVFCRIASGAEAASIIHGDEAVVAFMDHRPVRPGQCMVIPRAHVDHFTDVDEPTALRMMQVARRIGRRMRRVFRPLRVGMVVHGFGVAHAHLILVPQHATDDITSARLASIRDGRVVFGIASLPFADAAELDEHARLLAGAGDETG